MGIIRQFVVLIKKFIDRLKPIYRILYPLSLLLKFLITDSE